MKSQRVIIKKYGNRRLYDTSNSRYINLDAIAAMVREGKDVQVVDASSGEDLTRVTLAQVIMEDAKDQPSGLPLELLRQLIMTTDQVGQEFMAWYLKSAFDSYGKLQTAVQSGLQQVGSAALAPLDTVRSFVQATPAAAPKNDDDIGELRRRIAELEERLARPKPRAAKRKKAGAAK